MVVLVDANVLLRMVETRSVRHLDAVRSTRLLRQENSLVIVPQVAYEFWAVATRTVEANGLGMNPKETSDLLDEMIELSPLLRDERGILRHWRELVLRYDVRGVKSHDTRLVAAMKRHSISHLLTFNPGDFLRFDGITVLTPEAIIESQ